MPFLAQASSFSAAVDRVFLASVAVCAAFLLLVTFFIVYFCVRYSRSRNPEPGEVEESGLLEAVWTAVPLVLFLAMFYFGWTNYAVMRRAPADAMVVVALARQWEWGFQYPNGRRSGELYAALGRPMRVVTRSLDVIHGFYVPAFRIKIDVVPGRENEVWFTPAILGDFDIQCTVICGVRHSAMLSKVRVVPEAEFKRWYFSDEEAAAAAAPPAGRGSRNQAASPRGGRGAALLEDKGCLACHSLDGSPAAGPTLKGLYGSRREVEAGGAKREALLDREALRRAILAPEAEIAAGYPPIMPKTPLTAGELEELAAFIESLAGDKP